MKTKVKKQKEVDLKLPSRFQIGDKVKLDFYGSGNVENCKVIKVHFTESKVLYDVDVNGNFDTLKDVIDQEEVKLNNSWSTRLYNIDSVFVTN